MNENDLDSLDIQEEIDNFSNISFPTKKDNEQTIKLNGTLGNIRKSWTKTIKNHELSFDDLKNKFDPKKYVHNEESDEIYLN